MEQSNPSSSQLLSIIEGDSIAALVQSSQAEEQNRQNFRQGEKISERNAEIYSAIGDDRALVVRAQLTADLNAQKRNLEIANATGVFPIAGGKADTIIETVSRLQKVNKKVQQETDVILKESETSVEKDGLLSFIGSKFAIAYASKELEKYATVGATLQKNLSEINTSIQQSAVTTNVLKESITAASVDASARNASAEARILENKARLDALKYNTDAVNVAKESSKERLNILYNVRSAEQAEQQLRLGFEHLKLSRENAELGREERTRAAEAKKEGKDIDEYTIETINIGRDSRGAPRITGIEMKSMLQAFKAGGAGSKELYLDYENGSRAKMTGISVLGSTPGEAISNLSVLPASIPTAMEETVQVLKDARRQVATNPKYAGEKDPKKIEEAINEIVQSHVKIQYSKIIPGSNNIFDIGDLASYIQLSAAKNLPVVTKVLAPLAAAKQPLNDPKVVLTLVSKAVQDGVLTSSQAQDLSTVYQLGAGINIQARRLLSVGIVPPNAGRNYYAHIGFFGGTVDMTNSTDVGRKLGMILSKKLHGESGTQGIGLGNPGLSNVMSE